MRHVSKVEATSDGIPALVLYAGEKSWRFAPEPAATLDLWVVAMQASCDMYVQAQREQYEEERREMLSGPITTQPGPATTHPGPVTT